MIDYIFMPKATINVTMVLAIILEKRNALDGVAFSFTYFFFPSDIFCLNQTFYYNCSSNSMSGLIENPSFAKSSIHCSLSTLLFFSLNIDGPVMNFYKRLDQLCNRPDVYLKLPEKANQNLSFYFR